MDSGDPSSQAGLRDARWTDLIPEAQVGTLHRVAAALEQAGVEALLGGAFALGQHVGRWRGTKDVDFFLKPSQREAAIQALEELGFSDYFAQQEYDRSWIYRGCCEDGLVDLIWTIPNHVTEVDQAWFEHAGHLVLEGRAYRTVPLEELIWIKLYVLQRDRCDWPDVINLLRRNADRVAWERLVARVGDNAPLLGGLLQVLEWIAPTAIGAFPPWIVSRFHLGARPQAVHAADEGARAALLDSRPWYAPVVPEHDLMGP